MRGSRFTRDQRAAALVAELWVRALRRHHKPVRHVLPGGSIEACSCGETRRYDLQGALVGYTPPPRWLLCTEGGAAC